MGVLRRQLRKCWQPAQPSARSGPALPASAVALDHFHESVDILCARRQSRRCANRSHREILSKTGREIFDRESAGGGSRLASCRCLGRKPKRCFRGARIAEASAPNSYTSISRSALDVLIRYRPAIAAQGVESDRRATWEDLPETFMPDLNRPWEIQCSGNMERFAGSNNGRSCAKVVKSGRGAGRNRTDE